MSSSSQFFKPEDNKEDTQAVESKNDVARSLPELTETDKEEARLLRALSWNKSSLEFSLETARLCP